MYTNLINIFIVKTRNLLKHFKKFKSAMYTSIHILLVAV